MADALAECADVLAKLAQSMRIEGRAEHERYAATAAKEALDALADAGYVVRS